MAQIKPFKGIRYNLAKVNIESVVTQPYDRITPNMQSFYYDRSPYNIVRIELNRDTDPYTSARQCFETWLTNEILIQDKEPSIYPYYQEYSIDKVETGSMSRVRKGFIALLKVEDFSTGVILPHERTFSGPKEDRLKLLRETKANFGLIFMLYSDPELQIQTLIDDMIADTTPLISARESYEIDACHKLWRISDRNAIKKIQELMRPKSLLIADGHHRYETALTYSKENSAAQYRMVSLVAMEDPGLLILPTHRAIYGVDTMDFINKVERYFEVEGCKNKESVLSKLKGKHHHYGVYDGRFWVLKLKDTNLIEKLGEQGSRAYKALDVTVLHRIIFETVLNIHRDKLVKKECIDYIRDIEDGIDGVNTGKYQLFFILNPTRIEEVRQISAQHEVMPQKSTDFYPKLISGLVMYKLNT